MPPITQSTYNSFLLCLIVFCFFSSVSWATEEIAMQTERECEECHLDPAGGGELSTAGESYLAEAIKSGTSSAPNLASKLFRLLIGYIHLVFGIIWFGTILYVHLILKPAYASRGLPRGEKMLGIVSFGVMGVTGSILTWYRVPSLDMLFGTTFGILLIIKVSLYLLMLLSAIFVIKVIGPRLKSGGGQTVRTDGPFTSETLQRFDGEEERSAYFAYKGKVYDASQSKMWREGVHMKRHSAGTDLTTALALAPHAEETIARLPVVGNYIGDVGNEHTMTAKIFYALAYQNLAFVFIIIFIISLWKWG